MEERVYRLEKMKTTSKEWFKYRVTLGDVELNNSYLHGDMFGAEGSPDVLELVIREPEKASQPKARQPKKTKSREPKELPAVEPPTPEGECLEDPLILPTVSMMAPQEFSEVNSHDPS
jgi:hypothetical protein